MHDCSLRGRIGIGQLAARRRCERLQCFSRREIVGTVVEPPQQIASAWCLYIARTRARGRLHHVRTLAQRFRQSVADIQRQPAGQRFSGGGFDCARGSTMKSGQAARRSPRGRRRGPGHLHRGSSAHHLLVRRGNNPGGLVRRAHNTPTGRAIHVQADMRTHLRCRGTWSDQTAAAA